MEEVVVELLIELLCPWSRRNYTDPIREKGEYKKIQLKKRFYLPLPTILMWRGIVECKMPAGLKVKRLMGGAWRFCRGGPIYPEIYSEATWRWGTENQGVITKGYVLYMDSDVPFPFPPTITSSTLFYFIRS